MPPPLLINTMLFLFSDSYESFMGWSFYHCGWLCLFSPEDLQPERNLFSRFDRQSCGTLGVIKAHLMRVSTY